MQMVCAIFQGAGLCRMEKKKAFRVTNVTLFVSDSNQMILAALLNGKNDVI
jgi:hypothetical protein